MSVDLSWLIGKSLVKLTKEEFTWGFIFSEGGWVTIESAWRLFDSEKIIVTSADHGHPFGLPKPLDAVVRASAMIVGKMVTGYSIRERSSDLVIEFEGNFYLEMLQLSCGYDAWQAALGTDGIICLGGGSLEVIDGIAKHIVVRKI